MPFSPDHVPIIGRINKFKNLFVIGGMSSGGFMRGPMAGKLLAIMIDEGPQFHNDPDQLDYLQQRVLTEALSAAHKQGWEFEANGRLAQAHLFHAVALVVFVLAVRSMVRGLRSMV